MNEYILTPFKKDKAVGDPQYYRNRNDAIRQAKRWIRDGIADEGDLQVIYNFENPNSELSDAWWSITKDGVKKMQDDI